MPTVAEVLRLSVVQRGLPRVVAAGERLDNPVRWVHVIELPDAARLLHGGELVLSTGIALPDEGPELDAYVAGLASVGASALAVELGRKYTGGLPAGFLAAAEANRLPLIVFQREVPFVEITEAVHARIIGDQLDQLRASARLHEVFTDLAVAGAGPGEILHQASLLAGLPLLLADLSHHVLACEPAGADPARLLAGFEARSRAIPPSPRTAYHERAGWLVTTVGARGEDWGRVILVCDGPPGPVDTVLVERTATTLALGRLLARQQESLERQAHRTLISAILAGPDTDPDEAAAQARALGVPVTGRQLVTMVLRSPGPGAGLLAQAQVLDLAEAAADACRVERIPALVGSLDDVRAAAVLSVPSAADPDQVLGRVCDAVRRGLARQASRPYGVPGGDPVIGVGRAGQRHPAGTPLAAGSPAGGRRGRRGPAGGRRALLLPAHRPAAARPAVPARRGPAAGHVRGPGAGPAAPLRRSARHQPDRRAGRLPGRRRQQGRRGAPRPTWPGPPCMTGCGTSSGSSALTSAQPNRAPRCTWPCSPTRVSQIPASPPEFVVRPAAS